MRSYEVRDAAENGFQHRAMTKAAEHYQVASAIAGRLKQCPSDRQRGLYGFDVNFHAVQRKEFQDFRSIDAAFLAARHREEIHAGRLDKEGQGCGNRMCSMEAAVPADRDVLEVADRCLVDEKHGS